MFWKKRKPQKRLFINKVAPLNFDNKAGINKRKAYKKDKGEKNFKFSRVLIFLTSILIIIFTYLFFISSIFEINTITATNKDSKNSDYKFLIEKELKSYIGTNIISFNKIEIINSLKSQFNQIQTISIEKQLELIKTVHKEEKFSDNLTDAFWL